MTTEYFYKLHPIKIDFSIDIDRELTSDENKLIKKACNDAIQLVHRNYLLQDECVITDIKEQKELILNCFNCPIYVKEIANDYDKTSVYPWYLVYTNKGAIEIGWRTRVIHINWINSDVTTKAQDLFPDIVTTKYFQTIHASGYEEAKEYITKLLNT